MAKCCAPYCVNNQKKDSVECNFFQFPENPCLRKQWISNIGRPHWSPGRRSVICSAHFEDSQIEIKGRKVLLRKNAIPTLFRNSSKKRLEVIKPPDRSKTSKVQLLQLSQEQNVTTLIATEEVVTTSEAKVNLDSDLDQSLEKQPSNLRLRVELASSMDEFVVEDTYILSDCEVVGNQVESQQSQMSYDKLIAEDKTSDFMSPPGNISPALAQSLNFQNKLALVQNNSITVDSNSSSDTSCKMYLIPENQYSKSDSITFSQQATSKLDLSAKQVLDLSEIATPYSADTETCVFPVKGNTIIVPPIKKRKLSESDISFIPNFSEEAGAVDQEEIHVHTKPNQFIQKGFIELPVSISCHKLSQNSKRNSESSIKWQSGTYMCRLCGIASNKTINLFSSKAKETNLLTRISSILSIKIVPNDDLPQNICSNCLDSLDTCSELIVSSFRTHNQLASVMGQDVKETSHLPVFFHESKRKSNQNMNWQRHILLMEIIHEKDKSFQEYLSIAYNDLHMRLSSEIGEINEPQCSLLLASISNSCTVSEIEQARTAAEALICKTLICHENSERESEPLLEFISTGDDEQCSDDDSAHPAIVLEEEFDPTESEVISDDVTNIESIPLVASNSSFQFLPNDFQVMPIVDDASPSEYLPFENKYSKLSEMRLSKEKSLENMQKFLFWHITEDKNIKLGCRLCNTHLDRLSNFQHHLESHTDFLGNIKENFDMRRQLSQTDHKSQMTTGISSRYQCSVCSEHFPLRSSLKSHLQQQHEANAKCEASDICKASSHHKFCNKFKKEKEWQCRKCLEVFSMESELQKHQALTHHDTEAVSWLCDVCGKRYSQPAKLNQHKKSHLPAEFKYIHQCTHCPKRYINSSRLREHMQKHEEKKYMCKVCGKLFSTKQILKQHEFTHGDPQFLCSLCSRTFFRKSHLLKHMNVHNPQNSRACRAGPQPHRDGLNRCRECKKVFDQNTLLDHYKMCHPNIPLDNYVCEICKEENTSYAELYQHQREVHKTGVKDCPFCDKTIDSSTQMKYHLMRHEGMFPYNCPLCHHGYTANSVLQDHIRRKHTGEKPFECQQCLKRFPTNGALAQHSTVHSLPHQLLPCPVCNQGFKRKAHLDVHIRTHTGEKPYPCPICDRPFRQRPDCVKHIRVIHGEDPSKFDIRFHPNMGVTFPQVVSVADMELILEGEDLMQTSLEANQLIVNHENNS